MVNTGHNSKNFDSSTQRIKQNTGTTHTERREQTRNCTENNTNMSNKWQVKNVGLDEVIKVNQATRSRLSKI